MMRNLIATFIASVALAAVVPAQGQSYQRTNPGAPGGHIVQSIQVECQSMNYNPKTCRVSDIRSVRMQRQLSEQDSHGGRCTFGLDWTYDNTNIYVYNGCRGLFNVQRY